MTSHENLIRQSMRIYLDNTPVKFHPDTILKDGALGFRWRWPPQQQQEQQDE